MEFDENGDDIGIVKGVANTDEGNPIDFGAYSGIRDAINGPVVPSLKKWMKRIRNVEFREMKERSA